MSISGKVHKNLAESSWIRRMFEEGNALKQRYGEDNIFDLTLGNPVIEPPDEFKRELKRLVDKLARLKDRMDATWVWEDNPYMVTLSPTWPAPFAETALFLGIPKVVFTSAPLGVRGKQLI